VHNTYSLSLSLTHTHTGLGGLRGAASEREFELAYAARARHERSSSLQCRLYGHVLYEHGYRVGERSWTCIATGVDLGMAVVAAEVFVLRHLVRYLHGAHTRVCASVCVCVDAAHGISSVRAYATHPVHNRLISWRMEGSSGRLRGAVGAMGAMRAIRAIEVRTLLKSATNRVVSMEGLVARCLYFDKHSTHTRECIATQSTLRSLQENSAYCLPVFICLLS
jgi:hypothetical protein